MTPVAMLIKEREAIPFCQEKLNKEKREKAKLIKEKAEHV